MNVSTVLTVVTTQGNEINPMIHVRGVYGSFDDAETKFKQIVADAEADGWEKNLTFSSHVQTVCHKDDKLLTIKHDNRSMASSFSYEF